MALSATEIFNNETPFCHIVIPMVAVPFALTKSVVFPASVNWIYMMVIIWLTATLTIGRGWCSWACMYGGWDDALSRIRKRPVFKHIHPRWRYVPFAMLLAVVLISAVTYFPQYCEWLCPFKAVTEFDEITSFRAVMQTVVFVTLFLGLVLVLPLLTKRRIQCSCFCPFGAMQSFTNAISPIDVRIDTKQCVQCRKCIQVCPMFALNEESLNTGRPALTCTKCGKCMDVCHKGAMTYRVKGTPLNIRGKAARILFLYPAFLILSLLGSNFLSDTLYRIGLLLTTGSLIQ
jgi:polyferredoxin